MTKLTPMMQQYYTLKEQAKEAILFFRMGDFYEIFAEDAEKVAPILELVLTAREKGDNQKIPFCGVPHHAARNYWLRLVRLGFKVAIADQTEDPGQAKGIVKREIVKTITPGAIEDLEGLDRNQPNYILGIFQDPDVLTFAITVADISTGELRLGEVSEESNIKDLIEQFRPKEILVRQFFKEDFANLIQGHSTESAVHLTHLPESPLRAKPMQKKLLNRALGQDNLADQPCGKVGGGVALVASLLKYLDDLKVCIDQFTSVRPITEPHTMILDEIARRDLEIFESARRRQLSGSLFKEINDTLTPMGSRTLRSSLAQPLRDQTAISAVHDSVERFIQNPQCLAQVRTTLKNLPDLERLTTRVMGSGASPVELAQLSAGLKSTLQLHTHDLEFVSGNRLLDGLRANLQLAQDPLTLLQKALKETPTQLGHGNKVFRTGFDLQLDELNTLQANGSEKVAEYEEHLRKSTGITSLKVKSHKTFGLLIEVTKSNLKKVPEDFIRRQTMVNNERFVTHELVELDETLNSAKDQAVEREHQLYVDLLTQCASYKLALRDLSTGIARLDVLQSFAHTAIQRKFCRPTTAPAGKIDIRGSRHPVVESSVGSHQFAANDIIVNQDATHMLITGPNMAGKSTVMRQLALTAILNQIGSFVPATSAALPLFDRVFTRVGASDDLARGQSTFFVEMSEAAQILRHATSNSLVILDEVGRGTSTHDGLALASAILEDLATRLGCISMFATHYHELVEFAATLLHVRVMQTEVKEGGEHLKFTHRLIDGASGSSYGVQVAKLAGIPESIIRRAERILTQLGDSKPPSAAESLPLKEDIPKVEDRTNQVSELSDRLKKLVIHRTTPLQALNILNELKGKLEQAEQPGLFD